MKDLKNLLNNYISVLKKFLVLKGRASRKEFWMFECFHFFIFFIVMYFVVIFNLYSHINTDVNVAAGKLVHDSNIVADVCAIYSLIVSFALSIRRLHDTNHSGWWLPIFLVPFVGFIILLVFLLTDSTPGDNKYGPNPKGISGIPTPSVA